jgi:fructose-1-phosphate kinase PfkB-like protein
MREAINDLASRADWVLPGLEEGHLLTGERTPEGIARFYRQLGAKAVVVKLGSEGAYFDSAEGSGHVPGFAVAEVVDTVGAAFVNVMVLLWVQVLLVWVSVTVSRTVSVAVMLIGAFLLTVCVKVWVPLLNRADPVMVMVVE